MSKKVDPDQTKALGLLRELEGLCSGRWSDLPKPLYLDAGLAWQYYRSGWYKDAIKRVEAPLKIARSFIAANPKVEL